MNPTANLSDQNTLDFQFLVKLDSTAAIDTETIDILESRWGLVNQKSLGPDLPDYVCVSYAWGEHEKSNPFSSGQGMSERAFSVLKTVVQNECPKAIWVDAFCVPPTEPDRSAHLSRMGWLFSKAKRVVIVLSPCCIEILRKIQADQPLETDLLEDLEKDPWVSRVWTYQELVNNSTVGFVAEGYGQTYVAAQDLLQPVAYAIDELKKCRGLNSFEFRELYPRLNSLEGLIVDWRIAEYLERNAYQIMCSMFDRTSSRREDYSFAMIGALSDLPSIAPMDSGFRPIDYFMEVCEAKGDFSFIYSLGKKSSEIGRSWRPDEGYRLQPILPWHSWGQGQGGLLHSSHLELHGMMIVERGFLSEATYEMLVRLFLGAGQSCSREILPRIIYRQLTRLGFPGSDNFMETKHGYIFADDIERIENGSIIALATGIKMTLGFPAVIMRENGSGIADFAAIGILVGAADDGDAVVRIR